MIDPKFTPGQWDILWSLLYNVTTNNSFLDRKTDMIELNLERDDGVHVLDPLSVEEIREFGHMEESLWYALGRGPR